MPGCWLSEPSMFFLYQENAYKLYFSNNRLYVVEDGFEDQQLLSEIKKISLLITACAQLPNLIHYARGNEDEFIKKLDSTIENLEHVLASNPNEN